MGLSINQLYILKLLELAGQIDGKTKFQKIMFLAETEENAPTTYKFEKYHYGPFSFDLSEDLDALNKTDFIGESVTIIGSSEDSAMVKSVFTLTGDGRKALEENKTKLSPEGIKSFSQVIEKWNSNSLGNILKYVYSKYVDDDNEKLTIAQ